LHVTWVLNLEIAPLGDYLLGSEWTFGEPPSGVSPPLLYGLGIVLVYLLFSVQFSRHVVDVKLVWKVLSRVGSEFKAAKGAWNGNVFLTIKAARDGK